MTCTISIILYVTFYAPDVFRKGDALMNATTSSSPQARLGLDFLRWPEMGCSWTFLNPLLWPSREYLLDCDSLQTPEKTSPSSVQTGHNNTIIMRHITPLVDAIVAAQPNSDAFVAVSPLSVSHCQMAAFCGKLLYTKSLKFRSTMTPTLNRLSLTV